MIRSFDNPLIAAVRQWHSLEHQANRSPNGLSGIDVQKEQTLIATAIAKVDARVAEIAVKWMGKTPTGMEIYPDVRKAWEDSTVMMNTAGELSTGALSFTSFSSADKREIEDYTIALLEDWPILHRTWATKVLDITHVNKLIADMQAPYRWLARVSRAAAGDRREIQETFNKVVDKVTNPGFGIQWTLEQLLAALGLPKGALPVVGGVVVLGLGTWAYFTFLEPVRRSTKTLSLSRR